jgi:hypothetical protein
LDDDLGESSGYSNISNNNTVQIPGMILVADDSLYYIEAFKANLASINRIENTKFLCDGKAVVEFVEQ